MHNHSLALANQPIKTLLWKLSVPAMAGMFVMSLYSVVDMIFVGRGVGLWPLLAFLLFSLFKCSPWRLV